MMTDEMRREAQRDQATYDIMAIFIPVVQPAAKAIEGFGKGDTGAGMANAGLAAFDVVLIAIPVRGVASARKGFSGGVNSGLVSASRGPVLLSEELLVLGRQNAASLAKQLRNTPGTTTQAIRIAEAIEAERLGVNILGEQMFQSAFKKYGGTGALPASFAYNNQLYIRSTSMNYLSQIVHEGTHGLQFFARHPGVFSNATQAQVRSAEIGAYFFERQFQMSTGTRVDFPSLVELLRHVRNSY